FIGPALQPSEERLILRITVPLGALFLSGVALCFIVVLPFTFNLLYSVQTVLGANFLVLYGDDFIDFVLLFTLAFGLAFQLPVLMYGLSALGIVRSDFWKQYWRFAAIAIFLFGAIITPDGSGITMFLVALPELARGVGRALGEFRRGRMEIEREISTELSTLDARDMRMRVEKAAGALGVSAGGRSEMQLKLDIARAVDRAQDEQVVSAAQAM